MAVEFQESDVVFSDLYHHCRYHEMNNSSRGQGNGRNSPTESISSSVPIKIPETISQWKAAEVDRSDEESDKGEEMLPPHLVVERRIAGKMAFSVCTGNGRTLKGRDLSRVRNSILRMTGFLET